MLPVSDAIYNSKYFDLILTRHEQGAGHMAQGYARASGKPGVVLVTSGPGAKLYHSYTRCPFRRHTSSPVYRSGTYDSNRVGWFSGGGCCGYIKMRGFSIDYSFFASDDCLQ